MSGKPRVLVAMSGGVDSSVAAALLAERGYDVTGVFMRLGQENLAPPAPVFDQNAMACPADTPVLPIGSRPLPPHRQGCCSQADAADARDVAGRLGIPFYVLNFADDFAKLVDYFVDEYAAARTPNPCVRCNQWLKFGHLAAYADAVDAEYIATGHYARVQCGADGRPRLLRAAHRAKDQSYVLFGLAPSILPRVILPLGDMQKEEVRAHARRLGLTLHDKPESQDICFVPDRNYADLVGQWRPDALQRGLIRHMDGRVLGEHAGLAAFTVGQRRGIGVAAKEPLYVVDLDPATNTVLVGEKAAVLRDTVAAEGVTWITHPSADCFRAELQIRYQHAAAPAAVVVENEGWIRGRFDEPQLAVTPGQALVVYNGEEVLGGGWITRGTPPPTGRTGT